MMGKHIIEKYRLNNTKNATYDMAPVSLEETLQYISHFRNLTFLNGHFRPFTANFECAICSFHYDYILQLEQINEELPFVLKQILGHDNFLPLRTPPDKQTRSKLMNYLHQVTPKLVYKVFSTIYRHDFTVLGYNSLTSISQVVNFT